ncbi:MAG: hypothetical protein Ct9H300mP19_11240 [Dehalococcoidia bacterium]|nr:MAG: hypothetical protein Ct9H300mP19_11240 [Dehalococcoidia bacterium]
MGENTVVSDPNTNHAQAALEATDFIVVQDIFMTDTAKWAQSYFLQLHLQNRTGLFQKERRFSALDLHKTCWESRQTSISCLM